LRNFRATDSIENVLSLLKEWRFLQSDESGFDVVKHFLSELAGLDYQERIIIALMSRDQDAAMDFSSHAEYRSAGDTLTLETSRHPLHKIKQLPSSNDSRFADFTNSLL
jgi:hypothetical protein